MSGYAKVSDVAAGDVLVADGGFTCIKQGARLAVGEDKDGLHVPCRHGRHHLDGQIEGDEYIGLTKA